MLKRFLAIPTPVVFLVSICIAVLLLWVAFLQFRDFHGDPDQFTMEACEHGPVFVREMNDRSC